MFFSKFSSSEISVFLVIRPKISVLLNFNIGIFSVFNSIEISVLKFFNIQYYWTSVFQYSIVLKFRYWTFSVFNTIELRYLPVFLVFRDPDPHPTLKVALSQKILENFYIAKSILRITILSSNLNFPPKIVSNLFKF